MGHRIGGGGIGDVGETERGVHFKRFKANSAEREDLKVWKSVLPVVYTVTYPSIQFNICQGNRKALSGYSSI